MSKYELTISTGYVPDWTYVEAIRELFQNAIDNQKVNENNKMLFEYKNGVLNVCNKSSKLTLDSLLIGSSTKRGDNKTIGKHGEGYKIAFMVLLREGKNVTVYNYGANEIWTTRLVKSRRFNGAQVVQIDVNKTPFWAKVPNYDLTITVEGISKEEFDNVKSSNLRLKDNVEIIEGSIYGDLLTDTTEKGRIYVEGLYVCTKNDLDYGYNFRSNYISLDRDRKLVDSFDISWYSSAIWVDAVANDRERFAHTCIDMIKDNKPDTKFIGSMSTFSGESLKLLAQELYLNIVSEYGDNVVPVCNNIDYDAVKKEGRKPVIVSGQIKKIVSEYAPQEIKQGVLLSNKDKALFMLDSLLTKIKDKLSEKEVEEFKNTIKYIKEEV